MRRKKGRNQDVPAGGDGRLTPIDVQQVEFRLAFRGYNERDVDGFLDRITEDLSLYLEENQRLRAGGGTLPAAAVGAAETEARDVLDRAREEGAAIVRRAEQEAATIRASAGAVTGDPRAAVAPFLSNERAFLESLGSLVQTHAEEIKQMVLALRARAEEASGSATGPAEPTPVAPEPEQVVVETEPEPVFSPEGATTRDRGERSLRELFFSED